jgi:hypothetical protein
MEILRLSETSIEEAAKKAAKVLAKGGLVLFPTDTLYGIAADATNPKALIQDPVVVWSTIGACIAIALIASAISHLGSNTHGRPP